MNKRFFIVKDSRDFDGNIIPLKVINYRPLVYGSPIIKYTPTLNPTAPARIKIISNNYEFTIWVPMGNIRNVVDDIYFNLTKNEDKTKPQIIFRIITPTIDSSVATNFDNMLEIIKMINSKYNNLIYKTSDDKQLSYPDFIKQLVIIPGNDKYVPL